MKCNGMNPKKSEWNGMGWDGTVENRRERNRKRWNRTEINEIDQQ